MQLDGVIAPTRYGRPCWLYHRRLSRPFSLACPTSGPFFSASPLAAICKMMGTLAGGIPVERTGLVDYPRGGLVAQLGKSQASWEKPARATPRSISF